MTSWADVLDEVILGNGGSNTLDGGRGRDELRGRAGNDSLRGGDGSDRLYGKTEDDLTCRRGRRRQMVESKLRRALAEPSQKGTVERYRKRMLR
jgi:Ca2+-binding RTX toxin-like protein